MLPLPNYRKNCARYNNKVIGTLGTVGLFSFLGRMSILVIQYYPKFWRISVIDTRKIIVNISYFSRNVKNPMYSDREKIFKGI